MTRCRPLRAAVAAAALGLAAAPPPPVSCAIGEAEGTPAGTCLDAFEACGASMSDKLVWIQPNWPTGLPYQAWCGADGYTLAMKIDGTTNTFGYESPLWESAALLNGDPAAYTTVANAKLEPFVNHPVDAVKLEFTASLGAGTPVVITRNSSAPSLLSLFRGGFSVTDAPRQAWLDGLVGGAVNVRCSRRPVCACGLDVALGCPTPFYTATCAVLHPRFCPRYLPLPFAALDRCCSKKT